MRKLEENKQARTKQVSVGPAEDVSLPPAKLICRSGSGMDMKVPDYTISPKEEFYIGRAEVNHLIVSDLSASREHAKITPEKVGYVLYDLGSSSGTRVNGEKIDRYILKDGDEITIGNNIFVFEQATERRQFPRLNVHCEIRYISYPSLKESKGEKHSRTKNIGGGGICIRLDGPLPKHAYVELRMELPDNEQPIDAIAEAVWSEKVGDNEYDTGVVFTNIREEDRRKIYDYISAKGSEK